VLIAQAVFLLERRQTHRQTDVTECPTHAGGYTAGVGKENEPSQWPGFNLSSATTVLPTEGASVPLHELSEASTNQSLCVIDINKIPDAAADLEYTNNACI